MKRTIIGIRNASFAEDLSFVEVSFGTTIGASLACTFAPQVFERVVTALSALLQNLRNRKRSMGGHHEIHAAGAVDATALSPVGGGDTILMIREDNNLESHFALPPDVAARLAAELQKAIETSKRQAEQMRH